MSIHNSTNRFSSRAADYAKYRPHYPNEIIDWLASQFNLLPTDLVADIGAGTGISSELFLNYGTQVTAVEPNAEMRQKAVDHLKNYENFGVVDGTAEDTSLEDHSVDAIISAQAFHWFDQEKTKSEFHRILKPGGLIALIWNERLINSPFEKEYESHILKHASDYVVINHRNIDLDKIKHFFRPFECNIKVFKNKQILDYEGLKGRHLSSSYIPQANDPGYEEMINDLHQLFNNYQIDKEVIINYDTKVYVAVIDN